MSYGPSWRPSTWTPPSFDLWHRDEARTLRIPAEPRLRRGADDDLQSLTGRGGGEGGFVFAQWVAGRHDRSNVGETRLGQPNGLRTRPATWDRDGPTRLPRARTSRLPTRLPYSCRRSGLALPLTRWRQA